MNNYSAVSITTYLGNPSKGFSLIAESEVPRDPDYIEGAIELSIYGVPVLDKTLWDYVDQLWAYIANMVQELCSKDEAYTYFPDQPLKLTFKRVAGGRILVSLNRPDDGRQAVIEEGALIAQLKMGGREFFEQMKELVPGNAYGYDDALARLMSHP